LATYQTEMTFRGTALSTTQVLTLLTLIVDHMGFDDETRYELVLEGPGNQRQVIDTNRAQMAQHLQGSVWPEVHQLVLTNTWVKGLNFKLHIVRRHEGMAVSFKGEAPDRLSQRLAELLKTRLEEWQTADAGKAGLIEHERIFGSLVLHPRIAAQCKQAFLAGDLRTALRNGWAVVLTGLDRCTGQKQSAPANWEAFFLQQPPRVLLPDLSGASLRQELSGIAKLATGLQTLVEPYLKGAGLPTLEPALILKLLVVMSLLLERLETLVFNPAATVPKRKASKPKAKPRARNRKVAAKITKRAPARAKRMKQR
jgi:hypothetical protein